MTLKILIAEDDRHTRKILEHIFTKDPAFAHQNVELFLAPDGEEALKLFEKEAPDLVISDLLMPKLDGFALCRAIRKTAQGKNVPLIVTSAIYKETALLNRMREELKVEFFAKPFQVRELLSGVQRMLGDRAQKEHSAAQTSTAEAAPAVTPDRQKVPVPTQGNLKDRPLAALIFDILENRATGQLTLRRGRIRKELFFILGHPIGAESNVRNESMGHYLVIKRIIDNAQHQRLLTTAQQNKTSVMQSLVDLGWLSEDAVLRHHTALVKLRIINGLRWEEGQYAFQPGDHFSEKMVRCAIEPATIVLLGLKRTIDLDAATAWLKPNVERPLVLTLRGEQFRDVFVKVFGEALLSYLQTRPSISELSAKGLDSMTLYTHTYALTQTGMAHFGKARREPSAPSLPSQDPLALDQLKQQATRTEPDHSQKQGQVLYQELFGIDEISVVTSMPIEPTSQKTDAEDSGALEIPIAVEDNLEAEQTLPSPEKVRKEVVHTYLGIHQKNYYEILGVPRDASPAQIKRAYDKLKDKFDVDKYSDLDLGTDHPKLEELLHLFRQAYNVLRDPAKRADYDRQLAEKDSSVKSDPLEAELRFKEGDQHLAEGRFRLAQKSFAQAIDIDDEAADYHAYLGWSIYKEAPQTPASIKKAQMCLKKALDINPDLESALFFLGTLAAEQGDSVAADRHLEKVLDLNPAHEQAFEQMYRLLASRGDWRVLERLHRKVLHRLGKRFPERARDLWKSLARIYQEKLNHRDNARTCLEIASKLSPGDTDIQRRLNQLAKPSLGDWNKARDSLLQGWQKSGGKTQPIEELFGHAVAHKKFDEAFVCASILASLSSEHEAAKAYYTRYRPAFLQRIRRPLDEEIWVVLRDPNDDPKIGRLFALLDELPKEISLIPAKKTLAATPVRLDSAAPHFKPVLEYLCENLHAAVPPVEIADEPITRSAALTGRFPPKLIVSRGLFEETDHLRLAAALAKPISFSAPGRTFVADLETQQLKTLVMAAMLFVAPKLKLKDPTGQIAAIRKALEKTPKDHKERLSRTIFELTKQQSSLNVGRWYRGVQSTALRTTLVLTGDFNIVGAELNPEKRTKQLLELGVFALSEDHFIVRKKLGISIDV
jgi:DNA-binding response OmpR family regulator/curved DNA-binding protein CbpA